jgi:hypothetical protein
MAVCVAVLDKTSTPLKLSTNDPSRELAFHYVVHASLDVSCKLSHGPMGGSFCQPLFLY